MSFHVLLAPVRPGDLCSVPQGLYRSFKNLAGHDAGLLVLIGLGAKNAVLRVSAAVDFRRQGHSIMVGRCSRGKGRALSLQKETKHASG